MEGKVIAVTVVSARAFGIKQERPIATKVRLNITSAALPDKSFEPPEPMK